MAGCSSGTLPPEADPEVARTALSTALTAWQHGEASDSLTSLQPPIYLNDSRFKQGIVLQEFRIGDSSERNGQSLTVSATLTFKGHDGKPTAKKTNFTIDTYPVIVIVGE